MLSVTEKLSAFRAEMEKEHIKRENEARERAQREEEKRKRKVAEMASKIVF